MIRTERELEMNNSPVLCLDQNSTDDKTHGRGIVCNPYSRQRDDRPDLEMGGSELDLNRDHEAEISDRLGSTVDSVETRKTSNEILTYQISSRSVAAPMISIEQR